MSGSSESDPVPLNFSATCPNIMGNWRMFWITCV
jgi:hypothetical protein